jgi:hypothetical protein
VTASLSIHRFLCGGTLSTVPPHGECLEIYIDCVSNEINQSGEMEIDGASSVSFRRLTWQDTRDNERHSFGPWYGAAPHRHTREVVSISDNKIIEFLRNSLHVEHCREFGI